MLILHRTAGKRRQHEILMISTLIGEAASIAEKGVKEIVLTGVNIGDFGKSTGDNFTGLLKNLIKVQGIERFRISSIEPNLLTDELIEFSARQYKDPSSFSYSTAERFQQDTGTYG